MDKKRILFTSEWSGLSSGYGVYYKNIISRLFETGKYEILELANYAKDGDPRLNYCPWEIIPVAPHPNDAEGNRIYNSTPLGQFGLFKFEDVCIHFRPDIVISIFDYWYSSYILKSPLRKFFKLIWMPTVDSKPQRKAWIDTYKSCDKICAYSYFGKKTLEEESAGEIKDVVVCSPGIDDSYKPSDTKENLRKKLGLKPETKLVMMVCRNQMRKLIPDFIETLSIFNSKYGKTNKELVENTFFLVHTSNPDSGWDLDSPISMSNFADKVLVTYICNKCGSIAISKYEGIVAKCKKCNCKAATMTSVGKGIPREALADIMSIADIGVLTSIGEGFGMPIIEFKKVGTPVITVPWSAMEEQCVDIGAEDKRHLGGIPVNVERFYTEAATMQQRALFDRKDLAKKIFKVLTMNEIKYNSLCDDAKRCADTCFTWEDCAKRWKNVIDDLDISDNLDWKNTPPIFYQELMDNMMPPQELFNDAEELVRWCVKNWYNHDYFTEFRINELATCISTGADLIDQFNKGHFNFDRMVVMFREMIAKHNIFERKRLDAYQGKYLEDIQEDIDAISV